MNKEFGHWDLLCDEPTTWESFVYLMIDTNGKMYIGAWKHEGRAERGI